MNTSGIKANGRSSRLRVELTGGLANQLFQWAVGEHVASQSNATLEFDARIVNRPVGRGEQLSKVGLARNVVVTKASALFWKACKSVIPMRYLNWLQWHLPLLSFGWEKATTADEAIERFARGARKVRLTGLLQEVELLIEHREIVRTKLRVGLPPLAALAPNGPYGALHVRRGDYVSNPVILEKFGICSDDYYVSAAIRFPTEMPIVIVSDDHSECIAIMQRLRDLGRHVSFSTASNHYEDLAILCGANSMALSNSTFSWWGAFCSDSDLVFGPTPWFTDTTQDKGIALPDWTYLDRESGAAVVIRP